MDALGDGPRRAALTGPFGLLLTLVPQEAIDLLERGLIEESGRSRFGAVMYRTTELFEKLLGLSGLDALPDPKRFDPMPEDERELRERLLRAGEQRAKNIQT